MTKNITEIVNRIKERHRIKTDSEVASLLGMTRTALYNHKLRGSIPYEALSTYCEREGVSFDWLFTGEGPIAKEKEPEDFVYIPMVSGKISAGGGLVPDNTIELKLSFRREWVKRHGDPSKMSLIRIQGDSMEPTLYSGDIVLVDHNRNFLDPQGGIYAITIDDSIMIKRLQVNYITKKVYILSDNPKYKPLETTQDQIIVNGKVIWFAREIER